jgi:hypothetical protein
VRVARMGDWRGVCRIMVGKPEGRIPLGRSRRRWEDAYTNANVHLHASVTLVPEEHRETWANSRHVGTPGTNYLAPLQTYGLPTFLAQDKEWRTFLRARAQNGDSFPSNSFA